MSNENFFYSEKFSEKSNSNFRSVLQIFKKHLQFLFVSSTNFDIMCFILMVMAILILLSDLYCFCHWHCQCHCHCHWHCHCHCHCHCYCNYLCLGYLNYCYCFCSGWSTFPQYSWCKPVYNPAEQHEVNVCTGLVDACT